MERHLPLAHPRRGASSSSTLGLFEYTGPILPGQIILKASKDMTSPGLIFKVPHSYQFRCILQIQIYSMSCVKATAWSFIFGASVDIMPRHQTKHIKREADSLRRPTEPFYLISFFPFLLKWDLCKDECRITNEQAETRVMLRVWQLTVNISTQDLFCPSRLRLSFGAMKYGYGECPDTPKLRAWEPQTCCPIGQ